MNMQIDIHSKKEDTGIHIEVNIDESIPADIHEYMDAPLQI